MNIKGKSRAGGRELADHLLNAEKNEKVTVVGVKGTVAQDLHGAFAEMEAIASGTRCKLPLYHAKISPDPKEPRLTPEQWDRAVQALAKELGMEDHAYAFVLHQKYGKRTPDILREHGHVVFNRIDPDTMLAAHDGHNYRKHELVARDLEREFGHARIQGAHVERNGQPRPERTPPDWSMQQAAKSGIDPRDVAGTVKQLWNETQSAGRFAAALPAEGLTLAVGKRDLVVLDAAGDVHTLARCLNLKVADIRERMADIDRSKLPTVEQARDAIRERTAEKETPAPVWDRDAANQNWQDAVINAAIELEKTAPRFAGERPDGGTLAGGDREKEQPRQPDAKDDPQSAEIRALAALLYQQIKAEERPGQANDNEAEKERMLAFGFDPAKRAALDKWQELGERVETGKITEKDRIREMAQYLWQEADKERRAEHQPQQPGARERQQELDRGR